MNAGGCLRPLTCQEYSGLPPCLEDHQNLLTWRISSLITPGNCRYGIFLLSSHQLQAHLVVRLPDCGRNEYALPLPLQEGENLLSWCQRDISHHRRNNTDLQLHLLLPLGTEMCYVHQEDETTTRISGNSVCLSLPEYLHQTEYAALRQHVLFITKRDMQVPTLLTLARMQTVQTISRRHFSNMDMGMTTRKFNIQTVQTTIVTVK